MDGGGTKTRTAACDCSGEIIYDRVFPSTNYKNYKEDPREQTIRVFHDAWQDMLLSIGAVPEDVCGIVISVSGCDTETDLDLYREMTACAGIPSGRLMICNDTEGIFRGMTEDEGICLVGGTGAIACCFTKNGQGARAGGWGAPLSDFGSGYWIGARILQQFILWLDGAVTEEEPVYRTIREKFEQEGEETAWTVNSLSVTQIASVAAMACDAAYGNDAVSCPDTLTDKLCRQVLEEAQEYLAMYVCAACRRSSLPKTIPVVMAGGLFENDDFFNGTKTCIDRFLPEKDITFLRPSLPPVMYVLRFCRRLFR